MNIITSILKWIKSTFFVEPRPIPVLDEEQEQQLKELIGLINQERNINGLMPLDEIHELNVIARESSQFNYQYYQFTNKPKGMTLQFRLMKLEYPVADSGEVVINLAVTAQDAFNQMKISNNSREVMKNGFFCHIGTGKCGNFWTAVFARPRY
jgi:uncharacterized protein YkwD